MRAIPSSLRLLNQRRVLEQLLAVRSASRAELAARLDMSRPTAGKIIDELLEARVVEENPRSEGDSERDDTAQPRGGRPGRTVALEARTPRLVLVQLGVRRTDVMAVPLAGVTAAARSTSFATPRSEASFLRKLDEARAQLRLEDAWAFAMSVPGIYDEREERCCLSPNLHWIEQVRLVPAIENHWRLPGCGIQEIRALALGQLAHEPPGSHFLLVDSHDGVGAAAVVNGVLFEGPLASSGELGHTLVAGNQRPCGCGAVGCLETLVSRPGLLATYAQASGTKHPAWEDVLTACEGPLPPWMNHAIAALADGIGGALNMMGLGKVVLTGVFDSWPPHAITQLHEGINRASLWARLEHVDVAVAPQRRAEGLVRRLFDRVIIPKQDRRAHGTNSMTPKSLV